MSLTNQKPVDNQTVVQLEQANVARELLTGGKTTTPSPEVQEIIEHMSIAEIIS